MNSSGEIHPDLMEMSGRDELDLFPDRIIDSRLEKLEKNRESTDHANDEIIVDYVFYK